MPDRPTIDDVASKLAVNADSAAAWSPRAAALFGQQQMSEAAEAYREALARDPSDADVWANLGAAQWAQGCLDAADEAYSRSAALAPERLDVLTNHAYLMLARQEPPRAIAQLT